jgi:hypothetical protein
MKHPFAYDNTLSGVEGWLKFLCIVLVLVSPAAHAIQAINAAIHLQHIDADQIWITTIMVELLLFTVLSVSCGVALWTSTRKYIITIVILYIAFYPALSTILFTSAVCIYYDIPINITSSMAENILTHTIVNLPWIAYLMLSGRVKGTYVN